MAVLDRFYCIFKIWDLAAAEGEKSVEEICACTLISLSDFPPFWVYKSHILNRTINKLYIIAIQISSYDLSQIHESLLNP